VATRRGDLDRLSHVNLPPVSPRPWSSAAPGSPDQAAATIFDAASHGHEIVDRSYVIAGRGVQMRFAGSAMLDRLAGSFSHLEVPHLDEPTLRINIWDSASTKTVAPPILGVELDGDPTGPIYYYEEGDVQAMSRWNTLSVFDSTAKEAWFWAPDPATMPSWDWASPMRAILHWWLGEHGMLQVHGGAVGLPEGGVLVVGRGGSGKSTTALASLNSGLKYAGDDYVAIEPSPDPYVHSLYNSGKLETHHLEQFPTLRQAVVNPIRPETEKAVVYAERGLAGVSTLGFPVRAVLVPRIAGIRDTRIVAASPTEALVALAPSTIFQLHPPHRDALAKMAALVRQVPCYSLELGTDLEQIPNAIIELLRGM
jgi:hypothetical protein